MSNGILPLCNKMLGKLKLKHCESMDPSPETLAKALDHQPLVLMAGKEY